MSVCVCLYIYITLDHQITVIVMKSRASGIETCPMASFSSLKWAKPRNPAAGQSIPLPSRCIWDGKGDS